jgi:hypothetical protein
LSDTDEDKEEEKARYTGDQNTGQVQYLGVRYLDPHCNFKLIFVCFKLFFGIMTSLKKDNTKNCMLAGSNQQTSEY